MGEPSINISDMIRTEFINLLKSDNWLSTQFTKNGAVYIYEEPFETITISNYPACALFDSTEINFDTTGNFYEYATETFICQVAAEKAYWKDARNVVSKLILAVRDKLRNYTSVNALINAVTKMNIVAVRPLGAIKSNNNLWAYAAEIEFSVTYTEGYTI